MPKLLDENSLQAVKTVLDTKENVGNKVALGASNTTTQYPNAKSVWDEMVNVREVAEGKCQSYVLSYDNNLPYSTQQYFRFQYYDLDGKLNNFTSESELNAWLSGRNALNSSFNSQNGEITITGLNDFIILDGNNRAILLPLQAADNVFRKGDNIFVIELLVPDRWVKSISASGTTTLTLQKLEATKVDLTQYPTKTEVATDFSNIVANEYDNTQTYAVGDLCLHNMQLYKCITAISTAEDFDSSKWVAVKINGEFARDSEVVKLTGDQTITGVKTFSARPVFSQGIDTWQIIRQGSQRLYFDQWTVTVSARTIKPLSSGNDDLGTSTEKWRNLHISGGFNPNTNGFKLTLPDATSLTADSELLDTLSGQTITGVKKINTLHITDNGFLRFGNNINSTSKYFQTSGANVVFGRSSGVSIFVLGNTSFVPTINDFTIGSSSYPILTINVKNISDGTNSVTVEDLANLITYAKAQGWIS